ncbi:MAG: methylcobamide--CoM methyltransferase [Acetobacterium woodii]|nr:methylcobamide--CoM methyltransferase [Acetobacterium woodii]
MKKILDFNCTFLDLAGIPPEISTQLNLTFPEAYQTAENMTKIAASIQGYKQNPFSILPFCHTVEGEALGSDVNYGNGEVGPRAKSYRYDKAEQLLELPEIDFDSGRIAEVLRACENLRAAHHNVMLEISGPFNILNGLIDAGVVLKALRKQPDVMEQVFDKLRRQLVNYVKKAKESKVNIIGYADSSGGLNIVGPKFTETVVETFTYPLLKEIEEIIDGDMIVQMCPKTSLALVGTEKATFRNIEVEPGITYNEACVEMIGKTKFAGQMCVKNTGYQLKSGIFKAIDLK